MKELSVNLVTENITDEQLDKLDEFINKVFYSPVMVITTRELDSLRSKPMKNEDKIKELCEVTMNECVACNGDPEFDCTDCTQGGKAMLAEEILYLLQENNQ